VNDNAHEDDKFLHARALLFLENLRMLRDRDKIYSTYVSGLLKQLYTAADMKRKPEFSCESGRELHILVSSINPTGTKTGRPSCLIGSSEVLMGDGKTKPIEQIVSDHHKGIEQCVVTHKNRLRKVAKAWNNGVQRTFKLRTKSGKEIVATKNHKFLTDKGEWKRLEELKQGDIVRRLADD
jgi:hypothetical protein